MLLVGRVKNPEPRTSDFSTDPDFSTDLLLTTAVLKSGSDCIGILLYSEEKQQDFFGCLARFLGCPGLREADNPEI